MMLDVSSLIEGRAYPIDGFVELPPSKTEDKKIFVTTVRPKYPPPHTRHNTGPQWSWSGLATRRWSW